MENPPALWPLPNVWLGVTAENQEQADKRIPILLDTPAALRFVSIEPMLSHIDLTKYLVRYRCYSCGQESLESPDKCPSCGHSELGDKYFSSAIDWVIVGGGRQAQEPDRYSTNGSKTYKSNATKPQMYRFSLKNGAS
jgi:hypothetical protein